ncbi:DUF6542 domain-containing protein [Streptomyces orinoci]|uniref:DUF6542 domain-containing protein n=1 Tax=Streptomyces orinoci TaxID=67339 RepID=A0ABV3JY16_STRON|nr:DUF6542 domain-containing protein [Streptomyces orinoci]
MSHRTPGPRGRAATGKGNRRARSRERGRRAPLLIALALPVAGAVLDELTGSALGLIFAVTAALGGALAAAVCSRSGAWWVAYAPPPLIALITVISEQAVGRTGSHGQGKGLTTGAVHWAIDAFPAMAAAEAALLAVLALRWYRSRQGANKGANKGAGAGKDAGVSE